MTERTAVQEAAEAQGLVGHLIGRWAGAWIDLLVLAALFIGPSLARGDEMGRTLIPYTFGAMVLYFPLLEALFGATIGKLIVGTRIVDKNGRRPNVLRRTSWRMT